jgi:SNF2 family DNA or RNA helicase
VEAVLDELGDEQFVVSFEHRKLAELLAARFDRLDIRYGQITGAITQPERDRALEDLHANRIQTIIYTKKAGGVGIDLSPARVLINVQRSWAMIDEIQSEARNNRIGSERHDSTLVIDIVTRGTIEERQIARLLVKMRRLEEINQDKARLLRAGVDISALEAEEAKLMREFLGTPNGESA